ncbi:hypothetical protein NDU88_000963 [Pleurodeles waltl]|uniref:Uncharacterized protein n=1 Tax=Pleurodeles waltl TaxID=8319 RepID=A0AAV7LW87_PLEWA|nr:hypothetical protein NDU88_000963 [Pleurodeles waltl]
MASKPVGGNPRKSHDLTEDSNVENGSRKELQSSIGPVILDILKAPQQTKRPTAPTGKGVTKFRTEAQWERPRERLEAGVIHHKVAESELDVKTLPEGRDGVTGPQALQWRRVVTDIGLLILRCQRSRRDQRLQ